MRNQDEIGQIVQALAAEPDTQCALRRLLTEARRLTRAEAGTVYLRETDLLRFAATQNDALAARLGDAETQRRLTAEPLGLNDPSIAGYVALTRGSVNIVDVYEIPLERPYEFDRQMDALNGYRTCSMLAMPIRDARGNVFGVLQLINALNAAGATVPFDGESEALVAALLAGFARLPHAAARPAD